MFVAAIFVVLVASATAVPKQNACPKVAYRGSLSPQPSFTCNYYASLGNCFCIVDTPSDYFTMVATCAQLSNNLSTGELASFNQDIDPNGEALSLFSASSGPFWTFGYWLESADQWQWVNGNPLDESKLCNPAPTGTSTTGIVLNGNCWNGADWDIQMAGICRILPLLASTPRERKTVVPGPPAILRSTSETRDDGSYRFSFETEDGVKKEESGKPQLVDPNDPGKGTVTVMRGSYSYTDPDGRLTSVTWVADENGFRPTGTHLPIA